MQLTRALAWVVVAGLAAAACGNAPVGRFAASGSQTAGLTSTTVAVGSLVAVTGPLGNQFSPALSGAQAYLDGVNASGGVDGRRIQLVAKLDDATDPATDVAMARALVERYHVFAVLPVATPVFAGGTYLAAQRMPTFGYDINPQWAAGPTMFGQDGSYLNPAAIDVAGPFLAKQLGVKRVAVLAYAVTQSAQCAQGQAASYRKFGFQVVYVDSSIPLGVSDVGADVARMRAAKTQLVTTCMDPSGSAAVATGLDRAGFHPAQYWINGYDDASLAQYRRQYEGVYLSTDFLPFQEASTSPGLSRFLTQMHRRFPQVAVGEAALAGWIDAAMLVKGLRMAGRHLTRARLVAAVNSLTHFTADGIEAPVDWRTDHTSEGPFNCAAFVKVVRGRFTPVFHRPFTCLPNGAGALAQLTNHPGVA